MTTPDGWWSGLTDEILDDRRVVQLTPIDWSGPVPLRRDGVPVDHAHNDVRYSTAVTIARELEVLDFANQGVTDRAAVEPDVVERVLVDSSLSNDQRTAVERITTDGVPLSCLVGPAGTGKTTTIAMAADVWRTAGFTVRGLAVSAVAADVLATELGMQAETVAKLLWENRRPDVRPNFRIARGEVLIVDEASMVTSDQFAQLTRLAETAAAKIVAVGDYRQLGAVDAGGLFGLLAKDARAAELTGVWRFRNDWERAASLQLRDRVQAVSDTYNTEGRIHRGHGESTLDAMVQRWADLLDQGRTVVMLAQRRDDAAALSYLAREHLVTRGLVARGGRNVDSQTVGVGDQIVTLRNERRLLTDAGSWVRNGDRWTVTATSIGGGLQVTSRQRGAVVLPSDYVDEHVALGYALTVYKSPRNDHRPRDRIGRRHLEFRSVVRRDDPRTRRQRGLGPDRTPRRQPPRPLRAGDRPQPHRAPGDRAPRPAGRPCPRGALDRPRAQGPRNRRGPFLTRPWSARTSGRSGTRRRPRRRLATHRRHWRRGARCCALESPPVHTE